MDKEQAKKEFNKIIQETVNKEDIIEEEAKKNGKWKQGLDSNNELFKEVNEEARRKIELLASMIDE